MRGGKFLCSACCRSRQGLTHRTKATRRRAIPLLHPVASWFSVALPPFTPVAAFIFEELLRTLAALPIINRAALVVATYAAAVDVVVHDGPGGVVAGATAPLIDPLAVLLNASAARRPCQLSFQPLSLAVIPPS
ncbi:hypothetical protein FQZ97_756960 [compost metagenome]